MLRKFLREVEQAGLRVPASTSLVSPGEVDGLPEPARRYMAFMGVVGRPRVWSFRAHFRGRFRPGAQAGWLPCEAWQYNDALDVARIFHLRLGMYGVIPVLARDTYLAGQGRMLVRGLDWITLQDARGPALDEGELVTYLNDAVLFAPSQLLAPNASLTAVDDGSFDVSLTDRGRTVGARVYVDPEGAPTNFETTHRFYVAPDGTAERTRWSTPIEGWDRGGDRPRPSRATAVWHLPDGPLPYADFRLVPGGILENVPPGR